MRYWWNEKASWADESNPFDSALVAAALRGIARVLGPSDRAAAATRLVTRPMGPARLTQLKRWLLPIGATPYQVMCWAAANLAAHALLRPNEFLGTYLLDHRAIRIGQLSFHLASTACIPGIHQGAPHAVTLTLDATKADQHALNGKIILDHPSAVQAVWEWAVLRRRLYANGDHFFHLPPARPLSIASLLRQLESACSLGGEGPQHLTGRCFRRGGTTDLVSAGCTALHIQSIGRWKSRAMIAVYSDPLALTHRAAAALEGRMAPL